MRASRRFQVRLGAPLADQLQAFAAAHGVRLTAAIHVLLARGLNAEAAERIDASASLAGLTAAEHAVLMVASILPEGQRRMRELAPQAAAAADERLRLFRQGEGEQ